MAAERVREEAPQALVRAPEALPAAAPRLPVLHSVAQVLALQRTAGNQAVGRHLARDEAPPATAPAAAPDPTAATEPFEVGGVTIATYGDGAGALTLWCLELGQESKALAEGGIPAPVAVETTKAAGLKHADLLRGGGTEPLDRGNADDLRAWHASFVKAMNAARSAQAAEAATRAKAAAAKLEAAQAQVASLEPVLRDVQRARFRGGDEDGLLQTADAIANVLDTALVAKETIDQMTTFADELSIIASKGTTGGQVPMDITGNVRRTLDVLEKINKVYAGFQLVRAGIDIVTTGKTASEGGRKGVAAMATLVSAGGTLLNASAGFSLYGNLYIGPMTEACVALLAKLEDLISKGSNRAYIQAGRPELVNWSLEPGGRAMFDFMMIVMNAGSAAELPEPPAAVDAYFVDNEDEFSAGVGKKGGELPTEGALFWENTDKGKIKAWCFKNRNHLWGMLYGAAEVPKGRAF